MSARTEHSGARRAAARRAAILLCAALAGSAAAQGNSAARAAVQQLLDDKQFDTARVLLDELLARPDWSAAERGHLLFSRAWVNHQQPAPDAGERQALREDAVRDYRALLESFPDQDQVVRNLALAHAELGQAAQAVELLDATASRRPERAVDYAVLAGELLQQQARGELARGETAAAAASMARAVEHYDRAAGLDPELGAGQVRVLALAQQIAERDPAPLQKLSEELARSGHLEPALDGFRTVVWQAMEREPALAKEACVGWGLAAAALDRASRDAAAALPLEVWDDPCAAELRLILGEARVPIDRIPWWIATPLRRQATAEMLRTRARAMLGGVPAGEDADPEAARRAAAAAGGLLEDAIAAAPPYRAYGEPELRDRGWVKLEAARDLAQLHRLRAGAAGQQELDELARQFADVESSLFQEKGAAILARDDRAIQQFHTTLGLIYAEMEPPRWQSRGADNAIFQLEHALGAAERRTRSEGFPYQPLPQLKSLLAEGYLATDRAPAAADMFLEAAAAYLDTDALEPARAALRRAGTVEGGGAQVRERSAPLGRLLRIRTRLQAANVALRPESLQALARAAEAWAREAAATDAAFAARQRFKVLADASNALAATDRAAASAWMERALEPGAAPAALTSFGDIGRLRAFRRSIEAAVTFGSGRPPLRIDQRARPEPAATDALVLPFGSHATARPLAVALDRDLLTANRALALVPGEREPDGRVRSLQFTLRDGEIELPDEKLRALDPEKRAQLERVKGVRKVGGYRRR